MNVCKLTLPRPSERAVCTGKVAPVPSLDPCAQGSVTASVIELDAVEHGDDVHLHEVEMIDPDSIDDVMIDDDSPLTCLEWREPHVAEARLRAIRRTVARRYLAG